MDLFYLTYVKAIVEERNMTQAAMKLNMTQPALSKAIARLEKELELKLFDRTGREIIPNAYGKAFYRWASDTLKSYDQFLNTVNHMRTQDDQTLSIAFDGMYSSRSIITSTRSRCPQLKINEIYFNYEEFPGILYRQDINCAIASLDCLSPELDRIEIFSDPLVLIVPRTHPLAKQEQVSVRDIKDVRFIFPSENNKVVNQVSAVFQEAGYELQIGARMFREHQMHMLSEGLGCSIISLATTAALDSLKHTKIIPFQEEGFMRHIYLYWNRQKKQPKAFTSFLQHITETIAGPSVQR